MKVFVYDHLNLNMIFVDPGAPEFGVEVVDEL